MKVLIFLLFFSLILPVGIFTNYFNTTLKAAENNTGVTKLQKACNEGNALGCANLGAMYVTGEGIKQDYFKAVKLFQKACNGGNALGCFGLGNMYEFGLGVKQDYTKAKLFYGKGCDMGFQDGCDGYRRLNMLGY